MTPEIQKICDMLEIVKAKLDETIKKQEQEGKSEFEKWWPKCWFESYWKAAEAGWQACREKFLEKCKSCKDGMGVVYNCLMITQIEKIAAELDADKKEKLMETKEPEIDDPRWDSIPDQPEQGIGRP